MNRHGQHGPACRRGADWPTIKQRTDLEGVVREALGEPLKRSGARASWRCPFHDDHDPSFTVDAKGWRCWTCGIGGDAADFLMRHQRIGFPEAVRRLGERAGLGVDRGRDTRRTTLRAAPKPRAASPGPRPSRGLCREDARMLVVEATIRLWSPEGSKALAYLRGRGLDDATIDRHNLGLAWGVELPTSDGRGTWRAGGIVIPWIDDQRGLARVKIRQRADRKPKYVEAFDDGAILFPGTKAIRHDRPLIVAEGEFDAILLDQELGDLAAVVTIGSASSRPDPEALHAMSRAPVWYLATDGDDAGQKAVARWAMRSRRVAPPIGKDWTEFHQSGQGVRDWWRSNVLNDFEPMEPEPIRP